MDVPEISEMSLRFSCLKHSVMNMLEYLPAEQQIEKVEYDVIDIHPEEVREDLEAVLEACILFDDTQVPFELEESSRSRDELFVYALREGVEICGLMLDALSLEDTRLIGGFDGEAYTTSATEIAATFEPLFALYKAFYSFPEGYVAYAEYLGTAANLEPSVSESVLLLEQAAEYWNVLCKENPSINQLETLITTLHHAAEKIGGSKTARAIDLYKKAIKLGQNHMTEELSSFEILRILANCNYDLADTLILHRGGSDGSLELPELGAYGQAANYFERASNLAFREDLPFEENDVDAYASTIIPAIEAHLQFARNPEAIHMFHHLSRAHACASLALDTCGEAAFEPWVRVNAQYAFLLAPSELRDSCKEVALEYYDQLSNPRDFVSENIQRLRDEYD